MIIFHIKSLTYPLQDTNPHSQLLAHNIERQSKDSGLDWLSKTNKSENKTFGVFFHFQMEVLRFCCSALTSEFNCLCVVFFANDNP